MTKTILLIDDKSSMTRALSKYLDERGFRVLIAKNRQEIWFCSRHEKPDLFLLDTSLPELDGFEFIRKFRKEYNTPIIILSNKLGESDKVVGLELGADDYLTKPFSMAELAARIRAVLRRASEERHKADILRVADVMLDRDKHIVMIGNTEIELTPSEFEILSTLMLTPGKVFSRADLLQSLRGNNFENVERTIDVHISNLRTKIEPEPRNPFYVQTVFGIGYRFNTETEMEGMAS